MHVFLFCTVLKNRVEFKEGLFWIFLGEKCCVFVQYTRTVCVESYTVKLKTTISTTA